MRVAVLLTLALLGCETDVEVSLGEDPRQGRGDGGAADADAGDGFSYPAGPYGTGVGGVLAPLEFVTAEGAPFSLDADVFQDADAKLLLITTTAGWCTACIEEQPVLNQLHDELHDDGLRIVVAIFEDAGFNPATPAVAEGWKTRHELRPTVVADPAFVLSNYYDRSVTPMNMIVNVASMEILYLETGFDETEMRNLLETLL